MKRCITSVIYIARWTPLTRLNIVQIGICSEVLNPVHATYFVYTMH